MTEDRETTTNRSWLWLSLGILFAGLFVRHYLTTGGSGGDGFWYGCIAGSFLTQALYEGRGVGIGARVLNGWWLWLLFAAVFAVLFAVDLTTTAEPGRFFSLLFAWVSGECVRQAWSELRRERGKSDGAQGAPRRAG